MQTFPCSLDQTAKVIPWLIAAIGIVTFGVSIFAYTRSGKDPAVLIIAFLPALMLVGLVVAMYYYRTVSITVNTNGITIDRVKSPITIPFSDIRSARRLERDEMKGVIRTFGNGGVFGYTGQYYNKKLGSMTWYCTQRKNYILIEKADKKRIVLSPDDPDHLLQELKAIDPAIVQPAT